MARVAKQAPQQHSHSRSSPSAATAAIPGQLSDDRAAHQHQSPDSSFGLAVPQLGLHSPEIARIDRKIRPSPEPSVENPRNPREIANEKHLERQICPRIAESAPKPRRVGPTMAKSAPEATRICLRIDEFAPEPHQICLRIGASAPNRAESGRESPNLCRIVQNPAEEICERAESVQESPNLCRKRPGSA